MSKAVLSIDPAFTVAPVQRRTFGSFVEHLGRCVYTGVYEPGHPSADERGLRTDVLEAVKDLGVTTVRYPGGNFVSGYRWEDGVGPLEQRPRRLDLAWHSTETNQFGVDEFMAWAKRAGVEPMMAVNLGTRGIQEALDLLEYCNVPGGSHWSDLRRANGAEEPYRVKLWCLGNEMDGPWQLGHKTAREYGRLASQTAKAMRMIDPDLELVVCGSSGSGMPTFGDWENTVLREAYDDVDFVSAHAYYCEKDGDLASFLGSAVDMDYFIDSVTATCDHVRAAKKSDKRIMVSFDEWNVWYADRAESKLPEGDDWPVGPPLLEDRYNVADAVVVGGLLISLLRHSDRVHAACQAQLANVIAPIMTEPGGRLWRQTTFHPFALTARHAVGEVLAAPVRCRQTKTERFGEIPVVDAVATHDPQTGQLAVFMVNRSVDQSVEVAIELSGARAAGPADGVVLSNPDHTWQATADDDSSVAPRRLDVRADGDSLACRLPAVSWAMVRLPLG
ncbi:MAG: alpha-N-arabinofuranosidase [Propionibacteriaceae bacterium]|jgi:alpha-N-arabinofuranosidase|nr:alpha-N-arabinofuranosidase [Propionibacteriaceae bacterium]